MQSFMIRLLGTVALSFCGCVFVACTSKARRQRSSYRFSSWDISRMGSTHSPFPVIRKWSKALSRSKKKCGRISTVKRGTSISRSWRKRSPLMHLRIRILLNRVCIIQCCFHKQSTIWFQVVVDSTDFSWLYGRETAISSENKYNSPTEAYRLLPRRLFRKAANTIHWITFRFTWIDL